MGKKSEGAGRRSAGTVRRRTRWGTQAVRTHVQWCDEIEDAFLDRLAATCNVHAACDEVGVGHTSVYRQRRLRADFAVKWQAALEQGYARLEAALLRAAAEAMEGVAFDADVPVAPVSAETALALLRFHRASVTGEGRRSGWRAPAKPIEAVKGEILARIEAIARAEEGEVPGVYLAPLPPLSPPAPAGGVKDQARGA